jgi:hypothetical protein
MPQPPVNLFESLKHPFAVETGLDWKNHIDSYCNYVQAKNSCSNLQMIIDIRNFASQIVNRLPLNIDG